MPRSQLPRRRVLAGVGLLAPGLAGCLADDEGTDAGDDGTAGDDTSDDAGTSDGTGSGDDSGGDGADGGENDGGEADGGETDGEDDAADDGSAGATVDGAWPTARYGPRQTGARPGASAPAELSERWSVGFDDIVVDGPAVLDDLVLVATANWDGAVHAVDRASGEVRWTATTGAEVQTEPVVVDGTAYAGDAAGKLNAFDVATAPDGEVAELVDTDAECYGAPAIDGDTCYLGNGGGTVLALDLATGNHRWVADLDGVVRTPPALLPPADEASAGDGSGTVLVGTEAGNAGGGTDALHALSTADGSERWSVAADGYVRGSPTVLEDRVLVGTGAGTVLALAPEDGSERWRAEVTDGVADEIPVVDGTAFVAQARGALTALDVADGSVLWEVERDVDTPFSLAPAVADGVVYHHFAGTTLWALDARSGAELASVEFDQSAWGSPSVADGTVYVGAGPTLHALSE